MIYIALNIIVSVFLLWLVFYLDRQDISDSAIILKESVLWLCLYALLTAFSIFYALRSIEMLSLFFGRLAYSVTAFYSINMCYYLITFPHVKKMNVFVQILKWILCVFALDICFTKLDAVAISEFLGYRISSKTFLPGRIGFYIPFSRMEVYLFAVFFVIPAISFLIMLIRNEKNGNALDVQRSILNTAAYILAILFFIAMKKGANRVPLFSTLYILPPAVFQVAAVRIHSQKTIYDLRSAFGAILTMILKYLLPSALVGFSFAIFWNLRSSKTFSFIVLNLSAIALALLASNKFSALLNRVKFFAHEKYGDDLERDLPTLNFDFEPDEVMEQMRNICISDVGMAFMRVLIDNGVDAWESSFDLPGEKPIKIPSKNPTVDSLMNSNQTIIFRTDALSSTAFKENRTGVLNLFAQTGAEVIIFLNEGRNVLGMLLFGSKSGGNVYSEYDMSVFTKLYSYFFVFGYYMKNIANQSIVGTVNREIKMSAQIIASIQENMDRIKNPKIETGHLMVPARNIGGEFVDLIRISDDKHIFVLGDLSGKGISASMSMVITKSIIRGFLTETKDFKLLVQKVNSFIRFNLPKGTFFEGVFGLIDFNDNTMYYINCGVPSLFLYTRSYNNVIEIQGEGRVLGFVKDISKLIKVKKITLNPGDVVVACTDGLIDSASLRGEKFGKERIQKVITENSTLPADKIARVIFNNLHSFISKELDDDVSILVLHCKAK